MRSRPNRLDRLPDLAALALALGSAAAGLSLAIHHPLSTPQAVAAWLLAAAFAARFVTQTPLLLLAALPWIGLAPWSGWIIFEELDLLILACASGAYAALAFRRLSGAAGAPRVPAWRRALSFSPLALLLLALFAGSLLLAMQRGFADAGGFSFGWYQGYHEPMNSLRQAKPFFLAALLLPLWVQAGKRRPAELTQALLWGMALALLGASLACLAERQAFTGLLNFSSDYRSTGLFWEMHVGGAALDGCLALALPFAVLALLRERRPGRFAGLLGLSLLAAYAVLTTFSRGLYAAVPVSLVVLVLLRDAQRRRSLTATSGLAVALPAPPLARSAKLGALLIVGVFVGAATSMFGGSGYRGLLALLGATAVLLFMPASLWLPSLAQRVTALLMGALIALLLTVVGFTLSMAVPKAAYAGYLLALLVAVALRLKNRPGQLQPIYACLVTASWFWLLGSTAIVADYWGGTAARSEALLALLCLGALWPLMWLRPALWPLGGAAGGSQGWRGRSLMLAGLVLAGAVIASLSGGAFIRERMASGHDDMQVRLNHWRDGLALLQTPQDWWFGKGIGRFVANHFFSGPITQHTGDYRLQTDAGAAQPHLVLTGGQHTLGYGELFRVSQRIEAPAVTAAGPVRLTLRARAARDVSVQAELCEKQLLYIENCLSKEVTVKAQGGGQWQSFVLPLGQASAMGGSWYAPRFVTFSMAVNTTGGVVDVAGLDLLDGNGRALLANGDFAGGMARWLFSSDRHHLPWHIKSLPLHVLFEQGVLGLALLSVMLLLALLRLSFGRGREHLLAPALAASLVGFLGVGLFDSLLDVPRVAFIFYGLLLFSLGLRALPGSAGAEPSK